MICERCRKAYLNLRNDAKDRRKSKEFAEEVPPITKESFEL